MTISLSLIVFFVNPLLNNSKKFAIDIEIINTEKQNEHEKNKADN